MRHEDGFSLVEVLVAIVVLSIGLLGVAAMQLTTIRVNSSSNTLTQATTVAQDQLERLMVLPFNHADLLDVTPGDGLVTTLPAVPLVPQPGYSVQWEVEWDGNSMKTVKVVTRWKNAAGADKQHTLSFIKTPFQ